MRIYSALDDIYYGFSFTSENQEVQRVFHNDPSCRVCRHTNSGLLVTSAPIPEPYPNPERHPTFQKEIQGGPTGRHWYHGSSWNVGWDNPEEHEQLASPGADSQPYEIGERAQKHWNTDLGTHFSSIKNVAQGFASRRVSPENRPYARIAHANLHMKNPKIYKNENEFGRDAARYAFSQNKKFLPDSEDAREAFDNREDILMHPAYQNMDEERLNYLNKMKDQYFKGWLSSVDKYGPDAKNGPGSKYPDTPIIGGDQIESWLAKHPDREEITHGFRKHLLSQGHDGIIYGNSFEGPKNHPSAIAFPETPIGIHHWEYIHPDEYIQTPKKTDIDHDHPTLF